MTLTYTHIIFIAVTCHTKLNLVSMAQQVYVYKSLAVIKENKNLGVHCSSCFDR